MLRLVLISLGSLALICETTGCCGFGGCGAKHGAAGYGGPAGDCGEEGCDPYADASAAGEGGQDADGLLGAIGRHFHGPQPPVGGPPVGTVAYPYYTVRGPRDFLRDQPPTIGP